MKFVIFYEHQLPRPWSERSEDDVLQRSLAQLERKMAEPESARKTD